MQVDTITESHLGISMPNYLLIDDCSIAGNVPGWPVIDTSSQLAS